MFPFNLNSNYTFNTRAPALLGTTIRNAKLVAILDYSMASNFMVPTTSHVNIYPYLPPGTPNNPEKFVYLLFETELGKRVVFAEQWIDTNTIQENNKNKMTITISNVVIGDETKIRNMLLMAGFNPSIKIE